MRSALVLLCAAGLVACGSGARPAATKPAAATVGCAEGGTTSSPVPTGSVVAGPLTLARVADNAAQPASAFVASRAQLRAVVDGAGSTARERRLARRTLARTRAGSYAVAEGVVRVAAGGEVTLSVAPQQRAVVSLVYSRRARNQERPGAPGAYRVADGDATVTFRACASADTEFLGGYVVAGARCVRLEVSAPGRRAARLRLPFGLRGCAPRTRTAATKLLRRPAYAGVACPRANSIACDRVGLAVGLREPAAGVTARIDGQALGLNPAKLGGPRHTDWIGYLQPAGLLDGAPRITPDRGRTFWQGRHPKRIRLVVDVLRRDGSTVRTRTQVTLSPGWG
jgi:hypothetical protein